MSPHRSCIRRRVDAVVTRITVAGGLGIHRRMERCGLKSRRNRTSLNDRILPSRLGEIDDNKARDERRIACKSSVGEIGFGETWMEGSGSLQVFSGSPPAAEGVAGPIVPRKYSTCRRAATTRSAAHETPEYRRQINHLWRQYRFPQGTSGALGLVHGRTINYVGYRPKDTYPGPGAASRGSRS